MAEKKIKLWKRIVGYAAFSFFALFAAFFLTFPYEVLKERVVTEARYSGYEMTIGSLGPGFFSLRASRVELVKPETSQAGEGNPMGAPPENGTEGTGVALPPREPLLIDSVAISPALFPPGVKVKLNMLGGTVVTKVSGMSTKHVVIDAEDLDLSKGNLKAFSGVDFAGQIEAHVDLTVPAVAVTPNAPPDPDFAQASGSIKLEAHGLAINGGTVVLNIPMFGSGPTPVDLPKAILGELTGKMSIDKGAATVDEFSSKSGDLETSITGTIKLAKRIDYAEPNLEVRLKPDPEFQKRLGLVGSALSMIGADPKDPSWRMGHLTGYLGRPKFR